MIKAKPILDRIIIKQDEADTKIGNFEIADTARVKPRQGTVVAIGPGAISTQTGERIPMMCKIGDVVQYAEYTGQPIEIDSVEYVVLKEGDLLLVL